MIKKISPKDFITAQQLHALFQASYAIEAKLLKAKDFPPLKRTVANFQSSENEFYVYAKNEQLAGAIEIDHNNQITHIQSLVVHPDFFRQGIAGALIDFVSNTFKSKNYMVETGVDNAPAISLYQKFGFKEIKQWDTDHGIRKVRFECTKIKKSPHA